MTVLEMELIKSINENLGLRDSFIKTKRELEELRNARKSQSGTFYSFLPFYGRRKAIWGVYEWNKSGFKKIMKHFLTLGDFFVDEDEHLQGKMIDGMPVCHPSALNEMNKPILIVAGNCNINLKDNLNEYIEGKNLFYCNHLIR